MIIMIFRPEPKIKIGNRSFTLHRGDIAKTKADVVVCPSDQQLRPSSEGIKHAISKVGGRGIFARTECLAEDLRAKNPDPAVSVPLGSAHLIPAGKLRANHVALAVCVEDRGENEIKMLHSNYDMLDESVHNTLRKAEEAHQSSVAFPVLGVDLGEVNVLGSIGSILHTALEFLKREAHYVQDVILVVNSEFNFDLAKLMIDETKRILRKQGEI